MVRGMVDVRKFVGGEWAWHGAWGMAQVALREGHGWVGRASATWVPYLSPSGAPYCYCALTSSLLRCTQVIVSYMEIYNDRLHDLLQPYKPTSTR